MSVKIKVNGQWVAQSGTSQTIEIDKTLSKENIAADAKAVGDALQQIRSEVNNNTVACTNPKIHIKEYEDIADVLTMDFSAFKAGDIVLAYQVQSRI